MTEEPGRIHAVQKEVYMVIAAERRCSWMAIESSIRRALEQAWKHNRRYMDELTGYALDSCPTAAEFVYICAATIIRKHMGTMGWDVKSKKPCKDKEPLHAKNAAAVLLWGRRYRGKR